RGAAGARRWPARGAAGRQSPAGAHRPRNTGGAPSPAAAARQSVPRRSMLPVVRRLRAQQRGDLFVDVLDGGPGVDLLVQQVAAVNRYSKLQGQSAILYHARTAGGE